MAVDESLELPDAPEPFFASDELDGLDVDAPPSPEALSVEVEALPAFLPAPLVDERSFFAQPEPLKWIAGVTSALRIVASLPQLGQKRGPASLIPWITSTRCWQPEQT